MRITENIQSYHDIVAGSMAAIMEAMASDNKDAAKKLLIFNIRYAYTLYKMAEDDNLKHESIINDIDKMKLENKEPNELLVIMTAYQTKAGIKPVQDRKQRAHIYERAYREGY